MTNNHIILLQYHYYIASIIIVIMRFFTLGISSLSDVNNSRHIVNITLPSIVCNLWIKHCQTLEYKHTITLALRRAIPFISYLYILCRFERNTTHFSLSLVLSHFMINFISDCSFVRGCSLSHSLGVRAWFTCSPNQNNQR